MNRGSKGGVDAEEGVDRDRSVNLSPCTAQLFGQVRPTDWADWRWQLQHRLVTPSYPFPHPAASRDPIDGPAGGFEMSVTPYLLNLIDPGDPSDPIRRQFFADPGERLNQEHLRGDPLCEREYSPVPGLVQRYPDRVLVVFTSRCAARCRYCFRKRIWDRSGSDLSAGDLTRILGYLSEAPRIREVVISGGDPLVADEDCLISFLKAVRAISHIEVLRIATRVPAVLPMRVTDSLAGRLASLRPIWVTVQVNHPREITGEMAHACERLLCRGIPVLSQTVLLRGVNDDPGVLTDLFTGLQRIMVKPYYLHQCDPVRGAEHFRTSVSDGMELMEALRGRVSGPAIPSFVVDCPGGGGKVPVVPPYLASDPAGAWVLFRDNRGGEFRYPNPRIP